MATNDNVVWRWLERWSAVAFLIAGVLLGISTVATGVELFTSIGGLTDGPLGMAAFFGMLVSYVGLLGLYPRLVSKPSRLARASVGLLLIPVAVIIVDLVSIVLGFGPPFGATTASVAFLLFALGIALFGVHSLGTPSSPRGVGISLVVYAAGWVAFIAAGQLYGFPISKGPLFAISVVMTVSLLATGSLLRGDAGTADSVEVGSDTTV